MSLGSSTCDAPDPEHKGHISVSLTLPFLRLFTHPCSSYSSPPWPRLHKSSSASSATPFPLHVPFGLILLPPTPNQAGTYYFQRVSPKGGGDNTDASCSVSLP